MNIESMSLEEKIGQLCMFGISGQSIEGDTENLLTNFHVGNIFLTKKNAIHPKQIHHLTQNLQAYTGNIPLFIAIEQGGGINNTITNGVTISPDLQTLGQINNRLYTRQAAHIVSEELLAMGINMNTYIHANIAENDTESFGANNKYTTKHVTAAVQGCQQRDVAVPVRDFPGTGDLQAHIGACLTHLGPLHKTALQPFIKAIEAGANFISITNEATAHSDFTEPALFSELIVRYLLREKLGYEGVIMSEDLLEKDITLHATPAEAAIRAIETGVDLLVVGHDEAAQISILETLIEAVKSGQISESRIDQSVKRILQAKKETNLTKFVNYDRDNFRQQWSVKLETLLATKAIVAL